MTTHIESAGASATAIRRAGQVCLWAGLLGAASGVYLAVVDPAVDQDQWSYPQSVGEFTLTQIWFAVQHIGLLLGLLALWWSGAVGSSRLGRFGHYAAVVGMLGLSVTELAAISAANYNVDSARVAVLGAMYGIFTIMLGAALVAEGVAVMRGGVWRGWRHWVTLALGGWVFVPMLPALAMSFTGARYALAGWMLLFAALGWALSRYQVAPSATSSPALREESTP